MATSEALLDALDETKAAIGAPADIAFINLDNGNLRLLYANRPMPCPGCRRVQLCVACKAPWHTGVSCRDFQRAF